MADQLKEATLGDANDRHDIPLMLNSDKYAHTQVGFVENDTEEAGNFSIKGEKYTPKGAPSGKVVVLLSGSGGTNEAQLKTAAEFYCEQGATAYGLNYQGYGESGKLVPKVTDPTAYKTVDPDEGNNKTLYKDAYNIYKFVKDDSNAPDSNIIIHGYSLGGAVAAHLTKTLAKEGIKIGGLVLHSSIDSAYKQAKEQLKTDDDAKAAFKEEVGFTPGSFVRKLVGKANKAAVGGFNTKHHLKSLSKIYPDLPIHFMSGSDQDGEDHLAIGKTDLKDKAEQYFDNVTSSQGQGDHFASFEDHLAGGDEGLKTLLGIEPDDQ